MMKRRTLLGMFALAGSQWLPAAAAADPVLSQLGSGPHVILMRHATTVPGIGDPDGFVLAECRTQRNLSDAGRAQAQAIGAALARAGVTIGMVLSSRWCRCLDMARLAFGRVEAAPMLDSMFRDNPQEQGRKLGEMRAYLDVVPADAKVLVMVTHDVNIRALVDRYVRQGEMVVAAVEKGGTLRVVGTLALSGRALVGTPLASLPNSSKGSA